MGKIVLESELSDLDRLAKQEGLSRVELLNTALTFYEWAINQRKDGKVIAALNEEDDTYTEVVLENWEKKTPSRNRESLGE